MATGVVSRAQGIEAVFRAEDVDGGCAKRPGLERAVCFANVRGESGDLFIVPRRGWVITDYDTGTQHDAPNDDNRHVPIIVMAPGVTPQTATGSQLQVAPTVAALLGISAPAASTEKPLFVPPARSPAPP